MAKTQWILLFVVFLQSSISLALLIVAISTPGWIHARARNDVASDDSEINYGLFSGSLTRYILKSAQEFQLTVVCDYGMGSCMYSCHLNSEERHDELMRILNNETLIQCIIFKDVSKSVSNFRRSNQLYAEGKQTNFSDGNLEGETLLIGSGYWVTTVMFLIFAMIFTAVSAVQSIANVILNPVEPILSIFGIYIWNGISICCAFLVLIIWGALYEETLWENVAVTDTLQTDINTRFISTNLAKLGYSYFMVLVHSFIAIVNCFLLWMRKYLIDREHTPSPITMDRNDMTITFY